MNNIRKSMRNLIAFLLVFAMALGDGGLLSFAAIKTGAGPRIEQNKELFKEAEAEESEELLASYDYEELADYVAKKLVKRETSIDISTYNLSSAAEESFYKRMINTHAELFFVKYDASSDVTFGHDSSGDYCTSISPTYKSGYDERQSIDFEKYVKLILLGVDSSWSDVEKILYLHDYLITHCECVDYVENSEKSDAYSAIVQGKADCLGYSMAFLYLMEKTGVEAGVVSSASLDIAWNYVILDGKRYYVDVAMDDPDNKVEFYCGHKWLLNGKNKCATGHESIDWQDVDEKNLYEEATDNTKYDSFFWTDVESAIPYLDNKWYYIDADTPNVGSLVLKSFDLSSESNETVCTAGNKDQLWYPLGKENLPYNKHYSYVAVNDGNIYLTGPKDIYKVKDSTVEKLVTLSANQAASGLIYGMISKGNYLYYDLYKTPAKTEDSTDQKVETLSIQVSSNVKEKTISDIRIDQEALVLEAIDNKTYGDDSFEIKFSGGSGGGKLTFTCVPSTVLSVTYNSATGKATATIKGVGSVKVTASKQGDSDYSAIVSEAVTFEVKKKSITVSANDCSYEIGESIPAFNYGVSGAFAYGESFTTPPTLQAIDCDFNKRGTYTIDISGGVIGAGSVSKTHCYDITYLDGELVITGYGKQKDFKIVPFGKEFVYGASDITLETSGGVGSGQVYFESSDTNVISIENGNIARIVGVGETNIKATKVGDDYYEGAVYTIEDIKVNKKKLTLRPVDLTHKIGNDIPESFTYTVDGLVNNDYFSPEPTVKLSGGKTLEEACQEKKDYPLVIDMTDSSLSNEACYDINLLKGTLTVTDKRLQSKITIKDIGEKTYGDDPFKIIASGGESTGKFILSSNSAILSIAEEDGDPTATIHGAGTVTISAYKEEDADYAKSQTSTTELTIKKKPITIKADARTHKIGNEVPDPEFTYTVEGLVGDDTVDNVEFTTEPESVDYTTEGEYTVTPGSAILSYSEGYEVSYESAKLTVVPKAEQNGIIISDIPELTYGDDPFVITVSGGSGSGKWSLTSSDPNVLEIKGVDGTTGLFEATIKAAGDVILTATKASDTDYEEKSLMTDTITIGQKALTVVPKDISFVMKVSKEEDISYDYTMVGDFVEGDSFTQAPVFHCPGAVFDTAGSYPIVISNESEVKTSKEGSYAISYGQGILTVSEKPKEEQEAFAIDDIGKKTFGDDPFTISAGGGSGEGEVTFTSSDENILKLEEIEGSEIAAMKATILKAGTVTISAVKAGDEDYLPVTASVQVKINKMPVIVRAEDKEFEIGSGEHPKLTYIVAQFDSTGYLTKEPELSDSLVNYKKTGKYEISISGAISNKPDCYNLYYRNGTMTISGVSEPDPDPDPDPDYSGGLKVSLATTSATYTGYAIKPEVLVYNGSLLLTEGIDYSLEYSNNVAASTDKRKGSVLVTGKGNIAGSTVKKEFTIARRDLSSVSADAITLVSGSRATPLMYYGTYKLTDKDYEYTDPADVKKKFSENGSIVLQGKGNFTGTKTIAVKVVANKSDIQNISVVTSDLNQTYTGEIIYPTIRVYSKSDRSRLSPLTLNTDYRVYGPTNCVEAGSYKYVIQGIGSYKGSVTKTLKIKPVKADGVSITLSDAVRKYDPCGVTLSSSELKVYFGSKKLTYGSDYTVSYSGNKKAGEAKYTVKFIGNYKGTASKKGSFYISQADISTAAAYFPNVLINKPGKYNSNPYVIFGKNNSLLKKGRDYTMKFYHDSARTIEVTSDYPVSEDCLVYTKLTGKGNFTGTKNGYYYARKVSQSKASVNISKNIEVNITTEESDIVYTGNEVKPSYYLSKRSGKDWYLLSDSELGNYKIIYANNKNRGKASMIILGNDQYCYGSKVKNYSIKSGKLK